MAEFDPGRDAGRIRGERTVFRSLYGCILRTELDRRMALAKGKPITARNLRRLLQRRIGRHMRVDAVGAREN